MMFACSEGLLTPLASKNIMNKVSCLLRAHRLKWGLHQKDLRALIPHTGHNRVSRVERSVRQPNAREILAYGLIFGLLPEEIFPGLVAEVEEAVLRNAYKLHQKAEKDTSETGVRRQAFFEAILARAADRVRTRGK